MLIRREADGVVDSIRRVVTSGEVFFGYELEELRTALLERGYVDLEPGADDGVPASQGVASQSNRRL